MATDDLFVDDFWYDDDGFVGYVEKTVDPGPWINVAVASFCVLSLLLLPVFVTLGRKYERRCIRQTQEDEPGVSEAPMPPREEKNLTVARSEISYGQSSYVHGKSVVSLAESGAGLRGGRLLTLLDKVVMPPYPDDVGSNIGIPNRAEYEAAARHARSEIAAYRARPEAAARYRAHSEAAYSVNTNTERSVATSLMIGSTTMLDTGGGYRNRRAGVRRYRRALKEKQWREEQTEERRAEQQENINIYSELLENAQYRRQQRDREASISSRIDDSSSMASYSIMSKLEDMALSPNDAIDAHDTGRPLLFERTTMAGDGDVSLCCGDGAMWRPSMIGAAFDRLLVIAEWDREMKRILSLSIPFSVAAVSEGIFDVARVGLVANFIGTDAVAAYTIVDLILGLTAEFFGGLALTEASLCSQAVGCKNHKLAGEYVQISCIIYSLCMIPNMLVWWFLIFDVVKLFRFDDSVAMMAQIFARYHLFMQLIEGYEEAYGSLLEVIGHERWSTFMGILSEIVTTCVMLAFMLTQKITLKDVGTIELAMTVLFFGLNLVFTLWFGWLKKYTHGMFRSNALRNHAAVKTVMRTAIPLAFGQLLQYGEWEILTIFVAALGPAEVTTWGIAGTIWDTLETLTEGFGDAGEIRVAFHLGSGMPARARLSSYKSILSAVVSATIFTSVIWIIGEDLAKLLTPDPTLQRLLIEIFPLMGIGNIALTAGSVSWALVGAQGRYRLATGVAFISSWCITLPLSAIFTFALKINLEGVTAAVVVGYSVTGTCLMYILIRSDWDRLSKIVVSLNADLESSSPSSNSVSDEESDEDDKEKQNV